MYPYPQSQSHTSVPSTDNFISVPVDNDDEEEDVVVIEPDYTTVMTTRRNREALQALRRTSRAISSTLTTDATTTTTAAQRQQDTTSTRIDHPPWSSPEEDAEYEQRRRIELLEEIKHVQRKHCMHVLFLAFIPILLLFVRLFSSVVNSGMNAEQCAESSTTIQINGNPLQINCDLEPRQFMNAFTSRCLCNAIPILGEFSPNGN